ncbi:hypothetical protein WJX79_004398 [Trebouxia sp. C0005]
MEQRYKLCPVYSVHWPGSAGTKSDTLFDPVFPAIDACTCQKFDQARLICYHKHGHVLLRMVFVWLPCLPMIRSLEAYVPLLNASQLSNHGAVILFDCWVEVEWRSKSFTLDVQALDQCIHVLIREPALISVLCCFFGVGPVGLRSCHNRAASEACICLQVQQCLAYHAQLAII